MDALQRLLIETQRNSLKIGCTYKVYVTHVNNPHSFYVRDREYSQYMTAVQARGEHVNKFDLNVGSIVIYKSKVRKDYVRGKIIFVERKAEAGITCDMYAIDIGFIENCVPFRKIWKPFYDVNLPPLAFHCQLANCKPRAERWHETTIEAMKEYVRGEIAKIKIMNIMPEVAIVEVSITSPNDLGQLLAVTRHTSTGYMDDADFEFSMCFSKLCQCYRKRILPYNSVHHVRMMSGSFLDKFYAAPIDEYNEYLRGREEYSAYAEQQRSLDLDQLKIDEPVGVFSYRTSKFERGLVKATIPWKNKARVELVDWGTVIEESIDVMKPIPDHFLANPPLAIDCALHTNQYSISSSVEISNLANIAYPGLEFYIRVEELMFIPAPQLVTVFGINT